MNDISQMNDKNGSREALPGGDGMRVFVYGTLLTGESNHRIAAPFVRSVEPGAVRGTLYDVGPYPALVVGGEDDGTVAGEWLTVTEPGLRAMDALEEYYGPGDPRNDYERVRITDLDGVRSGWVYVWTDSRGCPKIASGSWRAHRQASGKSHA
jgi:gamma-glutamylcyclotransferase (GGCT)/AIG2-like uncharacterized protein YtfP